MNQINPKGCEIVAGDRSKAKTFGMQRDVNGTPEGVPEFPRNNKKVVAALQGAHINFRRDPCFPFRSNHRLLSHSLFELCAFGVQTSHS